MPRRKKAQAGTPKVQDRKWNTARNMAKKTEETYIIDRFEGDTAIMELPSGKKTINVPRNMLPKTAKEGSSLILNKAGSFRVKK